MAVSYVIDKKRRLVVTTCRDHLTFAQLQACQAQLLNDPDFNPDFKHLIDTTGITLMDVSDEARPRHLRHGPLDGNTSRYGEAGDEVAIFRDMGSGLDGSASTLFQSSLGDPEPVAPALVCPAAQLYRAAVLACIECGNFRSVTKQYPDQYAQ
ncbi:MAG TPA: hypothetical protein VFE61_13575 [Candidatus Sulfotelmatobacter sp.]|jgi:hypothetical protein|nr:hypothetical protein [Candidatus Sulfotelmatobacter sp.]